MLGGIGGPGIRAGEPGLGCMQVDAGIEPEHVQVIGEALEVGPNDLPAPVGEPRGQRYLPPELKLPPPIEPRLTVHHHARQGGGAGRSWTCSDATRPTSVQVQERPAPSTPKAE
jgi:hypothetical protein